MYFGRFSCSGHFLPLWYNQNFISDIDFREVLKSDFWFETILGRFSFFEKNHMGKLAFFSPFKSLHRRLILWKLKLFHFSSIKSSRRVISSFWCYRKFLLTSETILDTLDVCWNRLDDFFRTSFKNYFFGEILFFFLTCLAYFSLLLKKGFW